MVIHPNLAVYSGSSSLDSTTGPSLQQNSHHQVTTPRLPGSGVPVANATGRSVSVIVAGGEVYAIRVGAGTLGITQGTFVVPAGQSVAVSYKQAPTWIWQGGV